MHDRKSTRHDTNTLGKHGKTAGTEGKKLTEGANKREVYDSTFSNRKIRLKSAFVKYFRVTVKAIYPSRISWICYPFSANKRRGILKFFMRSEFTVSKYET